MDLDFSQYATGGAAARPDSFTRLDPSFATGVYGLTQAAREAGIPLQITSAYRSPATQARIIADGMARYGLGGRADAWRADVARMGPEAAGRQWRPEMREAGLTRMIAMPGGSQHQRGTAVDFALNGSLIRDADSPAAQFIRNNAQQYGLSVPMDWEPWQVEPIGNAGRITGAPQATISTRNAPTNTQTTGVQMDDTQQSGGDLSRNQRMMLGFAALRDAGAALQGQNSSFFADTMGGFIGQQQAAEDRAFRQMQFDQGVTEFGIEQASSAEERRIRIAQEERLIADRNAQTQMAALEGIATLDARETQGRAVAQANGTTYVPSPADAAMRQALMQQLTSSGGALGGTPTGVPETGVPETGVPETGVPETGVAPTGVAPTGAAPTGAVVPMNVDSAASIIDTPGSSAEDIAQARAYLERLPPEVAAAIGQPRIDALLERAGPAIEAAETSATAQSEAASLAASFENYGGQVVDYLIVQEGGRPVFDQSGNPVFNPMVESRTGRFIAGTLETPEYQRFRGALDFIANNLTFEKMAAMKAAGITFGSLSNNELQQVAATASTLNIDDPIGTYNALLQIERDYNVDLGLGGANQPGAGSFEAGGLTFEEVN